MKKDKREILIMSAVALALAVGSFFMLLEANIVYYVFKGLATFMFLLLPMGALALIILATIKLFRGNKISYIVPVCIALVGCILAFVLVNDASLNKYESDFLKHENAFNASAAALVEAHSDSDGSIAGEYDIDESELKWVLPVQKARIEKIDNKHNALFFIALDTDNRTEGYAYIPYGSPSQWDDYGVWSDCLDIDGYWYYLCLIK